MGRAFAVKGRLFVQLSLLTVIGFACFELCTPLTASRSPRFPNFRFLPQRPAGGWAGIELYCSHTIYQTRTLHRDYIREYVHTGSPGVEFESGSRARASLARCFSSAICSVRVSYVSRVAPIFRNILSHEDKEKQ